MGSSSAIVAGKVTARSCRVTGLCTGGGAGAGAGAGIVGGAAAGVGIGVTAGGESGIDTISHPLLRDGGGEESDPAAAGSGTVTVLCSDDLCDCVVRRTPYSASDSDVTDMRAG